MAGAPVSFGVFELTSGDAYEPDRNLGGRTLPGPDEVLAALAAAGYQGVDLGPVGWLGRGAELAGRLRRHGLDLAGGWVDLPFSDDAAFRAALPTLDDALAVFADAAGQPAPLPTLADSGSPLRDAHPGGAPGISLDDAGWARLAANVATAAQRVRSAGLEPTFHHHVCTHVETPDEIERFLAVTDVGLTLDTGHLLLAGGDPVAALDRWGQRVNHVHVKDARRDALAAALRERPGKQAVWQGGVWVPLGHGDLDLAGFMDRLAARGFDGWVVVEQDALAPSVAQAAADQRANREALRRWLP